MPIIGIDNYKIDFYIIETNDPNSILLFDRSNYLSTPEKPVLDVVLPGYTGFVEVPYTVYGATQLDSRVLGLTYGFNLAPLPDGVYQITQKVCPYETFYNKKCYLKTTNFDCKFQDLLIGLDLTCGCMDESELKKEIIDIHLLVLSAKAETSICNVEKASHKFNIAVKKLNALNKKLNCK